MTSEAFVWIWLPYEVTPVLCGKFQERLGELQFLYGRSYLEARNSIPLDPREAPLEDGIFRPRNGEMHGAIRDAAPDDWGRRRRLCRADKVPIRAIAKIYHSIGRHLLPVRACVCPRDLNWEQIDGQTKARRCGHVFKTVGAPHWRYAALH